MQGWEDRGWEVQGIEPNATMVDHGRRVLGLNLLQGNFESIGGLEWDSWRGEAFHCIALVQVLPHLLDPVTSLSRVESSLVKGGWVLVETWNCRSLAARLLGRHWHEYSPPSVLHWFRVNTLAKLGRHAGLEPVAHGRSQRWLSARHAKSLLGHLAEHSWLGKIGRATARPIPDAWKFPYPGDDLFWMLFRK
jgi:hypothetical protein